MITFSNGQVSVNESEIKLFSGHIINMRLTINSDEIIYKENIKTPL